MLTDTEYMARALTIAERGRGRTSPNPMVGAVVVDREGVVVGRGSHEFAGGPHAEVFALREAGRRAVGGTLYVTLEPCCHTNKRTAPCTPLIEGSGVRRVVIAQTDPNPLVSGRGIRRLRRAGLSVEAGCCLEDARRLNRVYSHWMETGRPLVILKAGMTTLARAEASGLPLQCEVLSQCLVLLHLRHSELQPAGVGVVAGNWHPFLLADLCPVGPRQQPAQAVVAP